MIIRICSQEVSKEYSRGILTGHHSNHQESNDVERRVALRNRILHLFDPPHQMMSSLQLRVEAQLEEFGAAIAEATDLVKSYFPEFLKGWNNLFPIIWFQVVPPLAEK